ncbi:MAG: efflux RND transporter permease subunit [Candidatus Krumholzibacteriia bacterium]
MPARSPGGSPVIRFAVDHPVATWMAFAALLVMGLYALPRLDVEAMPETALPELTITTAWNGASPSAVQRSITVPIEEAVAGCHGVEELTSTSRHGRSEVTVAFRREVDIEFARLEVSEQLAAVRRHLPAQASQPQIVPYVPEELRTEEFFVVSLISPLPANELREEAERWLVPRVLAVPGVADAELRGGARPLVKVLLDLQAMERYGLTADGIFRAVSALDDILPAGAVHRSGREFTVSVKDAATVDALSGAVLANLGGQTLTLGHVARVERAFEDAAYFVRINGENVITLNVVKRSAQNSVTVSRRLRAALPEIRAAMPFPVTFDIDEDEGRDLEEKLRDLVIRSLVILGLLFALLAVVLRQVRLVAIVVASILLAIVICLSLFYFFGISVNFITISGLTVCFGMLLDNSILVLDAIHRRLAGRRDAGVREVLVRGASEVAFPILATTFTTVVAFLSFTFLTDRLSLFYVPLAMSVGIAMLASVFVAFCWMPVALRGAAARTLRTTVAGGDEFRVRGWSLLWRWALAVLAVGLAVLGGAAAWQGMRWARDLVPWTAGAAGLLLLVGVFVAWVDAITRLHLRFWWYPTVLIVVLFAGTWWAFDEKVSHGGFWRPRSQEQIFVYLERPVGTDVKLASATMALFERELLPVPEGVTMRSTSFDNRAFMSIEFDEELLASAYPELYRNKLIVLAEELGGMFIWLAGFGDPYMKGGRGGGQSNSTIELTGYNSKELKRISDGIVSRLERNRRARNVRLTSGDRFDRAGTDETVVVIDRAALVSHRLSVAEMVGHLRRLLGVDTPWNMILDGEHRRVQLSFAESEEIQADQVLARTITTSRGQRVQLGKLVRLESRPEITSINRKDQRYRQLVNWEYIGTDKMRRRFIGDLLAELDLPYGYSAEDVSGEQVTPEEEEQLRDTLIFTLVFIMMTLAALFESLALPWLVLLAVPMSLVGVAGIFWAEGSDFDSSARIGLVLMAGIVVNNAILLVNRFRLQVRELLEERGLVAAGGAPAAGAANGLLPAKRGLGGFDLWRLAAPERQGILRTAIVDGVRIQMRSILLTSGTTIAGLLPLIYSSGEAQGKDIWENLALASIGGLASSTVLILMAMPALYWICTRWGWGLRRLGARLRGRAPAAAVVTPPPGSLSPDTR